MTEFLRCSRAYRLFESASVGSSLWAPRKKNFVRPGKKRSKPCQIYGPSYSIPTRIGLLVRCNPVSGSDARRNSSLHRKKILQRRTLSALFFGTSGFPPFHVDALWSKTKGKNRTLVIVRASSSRLRWPDWFSSILPGIYFFFGS